MPKINREEYEVLKELDDKWKWIARDGESLMHGGVIQAYTEMPKKRAGVMWSNGWGSEKLLVGSLFQFIQWEDESPYNIAELIEEYESEETEVKRDIEWVNEEIKKVRDLLNNKRYEEEVDDLTTGVLSGLKKALNILDQLDEPEVLSQELPVIPKFVADWIEDNKDKYERDILAVGHVFYRRNLDNLDVDEWVQYNTEDFTRAWLDGYTIKKEQKYYAKIKGWENVTTGSEAFNWVYFKEKDTVGISKAVENKYQAVSFTKYDWNNLGINEHNADFVLVEELEE